MDHFAQIGVMEVFLEATPSAFLFLILIVSAVDRYINNGLYGNNDNGLLVLLWGPGVGTFWGNVQFALFFLSCGSSIFSSSFGVARWSRDISNI